jgi:beta-glucanase (GH16 family)
MVLLPILATLLVGCVPEGNQEEKGATITVAPTSLVASGGGEEIILTVNSDADWGIFSSEEWVVCSPTGGVAGTANVRIKVDANPSYTAPREANITVKSGSTRQEVPLCQEVGSAPADMYTPEGYALLWSDEFDGRQLNANTWTMETGASGWGNNELQNYTSRPENVKVADGHLVITARKESYEGAPVTSGRLITKDKFHFLYGYVVAAIRLPKTANGLWPAFWMMGNDFSQVGWPKCGETDILEMGNADGIKNGTQERLMNGACHWGQSHAQHVVNPYSLQDGEFHTYTCVWDENYIRMYIDREKNPNVRPYFEMRITDNMGGANAFRKSNFLLFNMAVGGNFPGIHNIDDVTALDKGPAEMVVDYVRVFQKK